MLSKFLFYSSQNVYMESVREIYLMDCFYDFLKTQLFFAFFPLKI